MRKIDQDGGKALRIRGLISWLLVGLLVLGGMVPAMAEENYEYYEDDGYSEEEPYEEETEFIPEAYYDPIQSNAIEGWPQGPAVQAAGAVVMDMDTGTVLYSKNATNTYYPASITKIMTALVAIENGDLDKQMACSELVYDIEEGSSHLGIAPGEELTLRQALYGLMLESANDLGMAIAVEIGGSLQGFVDLMNEKAASLGCENTHFTNPHGLHNENHYTTALDFARISIAAYANPTFRKICSTVEYEIPPTNTTEETRYLLNHHRMLQHSSEYYQEWCTGGKTGFTSDAWNTLVTYGEKNGLRLVCVLLRGNGAYRNYDETTALMNYGFDNFVRVNLTAGITTPTFYQLLGQTDPSGGTVLVRNEKLMQTATSVVSDAIATLPEGAQMQGITSQSVTGDGVLTFYYNGWPVGGGQIAVTQLPTDITFDFEAYRDMDEVLKDSEARKKQKEIRETGEKAIASIQNVVTGTVEKITDYVENNKLTAALIGGFLLLILLILILILILRCTRELRIQRRREQEEKQRLKNAEEIDRMSAAQIEEELRSAMEAERLRQEEEAARLAEQKRLEEELLENERIVDAIQQSSRIENR